MIRAFEVGSSRRAPVSAKTATVAPFSATARNRLAVFRRERCHPILTTSTASIELRAHFLFAREKLPCALHAPVGRVLLYLYSVLSSAHAFAFPPSIYRKAWPRPFQSRGGRRPAARGLIIIIIQCRPLRTFNAGLFLQRVLPAEPQPGPL